MVKDKKIRVDIELAEILKEISIERIKKNKDTKLRSSRRITKAIRRHPGFNDVIVPDVIDADLDNE
jgi:hypothetical protein